MSIKRVKTINRICVILFLLLAAALMLLSLTAVSESVWVEHDADFALITSWGLVIKKLGISPLSAPDLKSALRLMLDMESALLLAGAIALAAALVLSVRHVLLRRRISLMAKQILIALPLTAVGLHIIYVEVTKDIREMSSTHLQAEYFLSGIRSALTLRIFALVLVIMLSCLILSFIAIKRFAGLRRAAVALSRGEYGYRVRVKGNDEVTDIARAFNSMAERVEHSFDAISKTNSSFSRFVPQELFAILGKESALDINPGDSALRRCSLLCFYTSAFEEYTGGDLFDNLSRYYQEVMPAVHSEGGVVEHCSETEMLALFQKPPSSAILAAGRIIDALRNSGAVVGNCADSCCAVIGCRSIRIGVIGHENKLSAVVVSGFIRESRLIGNLAEKLGCRILMTGEAYSQGGLPKGAAFRFIGNAEVGNVTYPLYEVFPDGPYTERFREAKLFGRAVELYYSSEFYEARNLFVEVIKKSPGDLVAREYLLLSDILLQTSEPPRPLLSAGGK